MGHGAEPRAGPHDRLVHLEADGTDPNRSQMALSAASVQLLPAGEVFKWTVGRWRS
ncbi:Delta-like protein B [Clarias magur]|uniref:Delta-like protein B n=1 Tax=Clarias magur TaxID=1594786 RepID=A0A8J4WVN2_CLAMG|nr:Delta-like protein B [Clarias magur]